MNTLRSFFVLLFMCGCLLPARSQEPASDPAPKTDAVDPDVLRKVRKLIRGTLEEDAAAREKSWNDIREMGNLITPGLLELARLKETAPVMLSSILLALGDSKDPRGGPALLEFLSSPDLNLRRGAARALGESGSKSALGDLEALASKDSEDEEVRLFAASSAAKLGSLKALKILQQLAQSEKAELRSRAVFALGKFGGAEQVAAVAGALKDADVSVREDAVEALRRLRLRSAQEALMTALDDSDFHVRNAAMQALRDMTGQKFENDPKEWRGWWEQHKSDPEAPPSMKIKKFDKNES